MQSLEDGGVVAPESFSCKMLRMAVAVVCAVP